MRVSAPAMLRAALGAAAALLALMVAIGHEGLQRRIIDDVRRLIELPWDELATIAGLIILVAAGCGAVVERRRRARLRSMLDWQTRQEEAVRALALRDPLTDLLNRRGLEARFADVVADGHGRAIALCDLDGFKHVNDTFGHAAGDDLLRRFARQLTSLECHGAKLDCVRLGGDEFVVLITAADPLEQALDVARSVVALLDVADDPSWPLSVSIGIAHGPATGPLDDLLVAADAAMYDAKKSGDPYRVFCPETAATARGRTRLFERHASQDDDETRFFVAAIGLDHYRRIRRIHGHGVCSKIMRALQRALEDAGFAAVERMAPETLGVLIPTGSSADAQDGLDNLLCLLSQQHQVCPPGVTLSLTGGLAGPAGASALRDLAEMSQNGLDEAWRTGQRTVLYDTVRQESAEADRMLLEDLAVALAADQLDLHYQPKLCSRTGAIDSLEALARWDHPTLGPIPPSRFIAVAEQTGVIRMLTDWVVDRAIADQLVLERQGVSRPIYINISARLICEADFAATLLRKLSAHPGKIGIEITETAVLGDPDRALRHLKEFADAGVSIAIDDYGVGLSSLAYLKQLPANELKIDMLFISDLADSHRDPMIVRSTIDLAHGLGLRVTAEGVDNPMTEGLLRVMGCDLIQGFLVSQPLDLAAIAAFLSAHEAPMTNFIDFNDYYAAA